MIRTARAIWATLPRDARLPCVLGLLMPILIVVAWRLVTWTAAGVFDLPEPEPGEVGVEQTIARVAFNVSIGAVTMALGRQINARREWLGDVIDQAGVGLLALTVVFALLGAETMAWRGVTFVQQSVMVGGWAALWRVRRRWLSRAVAGWMTLVSLGMLGLHTLASFVLTDPVEAGLMAWSVEPALLARTMHGAGEAVGFVTWPLVGTVFYKYWRRHGPGAKA